MGKFKLGDSVRKVRGSQWRGRVVGFYSTSLTPEGYAVESDTEEGSVQIYPAAALELQENNYVVGGVSELLEQLRSELAGDKGWDYTEYEKGRLAEKERVISQIALLAARPGGEES